MLPSLERPVVQLPVERWHNEGKVLLHAVSEPEDSPMDSDDLQAQTTHSGEKETTNGKPSKPSLTDILSCFARENWTLPAFLLLATGCRVAAQASQRGLRDAVAEAVVFLAGAAVVVVWLELGTGKQPAKAQPIRNRRVEAWLIPLLIVMVFHNILRAAKFWHLQFLDPLYAFSARWLERPMAAFFSHVLPESVKALPSVSSEMAAGFGITTVVIVLVIPLVVLRCVGYPFRELGFRWAHGKLTVVLAGFFVLANAATGMLPNAEWLVRFMVQLVFAGLREEFWYRAVLQTKMEPFFRKPSSAVVVGALVFALWHLPITLSQTHDLTWPGALLRCLGGQGGNGFLLGYVYFRTRSLLPAVTLHAVINSYALQA